MTYVYEFISIIKAAEGIFIPDAAFCLNNHKNFTKNIAKAIDITAPKCYIILVVSTQT